jgi:putative phage-type endonuclease
MKTDENMALSPKTLKEKCRQVFSEMQVTKDQAHNAEYLTRDQSQCKEWHALRTGRITASNMKAVCSASIEKPAMSTLNSICGTSRYSNKAIMWGCRHESSALLEYSAQYKKDHTNVKIDKCGLFINPKYPHLGASPDGLVSCDCCGEGVIEVKCPFCVKDKKISESDDKIEFLNHGKLKENHKYYYQVQTQMLITEKEFCDFVVWTQEDMTVQRIEPDQDSHDEIVTKSTNFFVQVVLPEIMGNFVTRDMLESKKKKADENAQKSGEKSDENKIKLKDKLQQIAVLKPTENVQHEQNKVDSEAKKDCEIICLCQKPYDENEDDVIGCDDENCPYVWFHFSCVGIRKVPKGKYFCPYCFQGKRKKPKKAIK